MLYKIARYYDYHSIQRNDVHRGQRSIPRLRKKITQNLVQLFVNSPSWGARSHAKWSLKLLGGRARRPVPLSHVHPTRAPKQGESSWPPLSILDKDSCSTLGHTLAQQEAVPPSYLDTAPSSCQERFLSFLPFLFFLFSLFSLSFFFITPKAKFICQVLKEASCPFYAGSPQQRSEIVYFAAKKSPGLYNFNNRKLIFALQCVKAWRKTGSIQVTGALQMSGSPLF